MNSSLKKVLLLPLLLFSITISAQTITGKISGIIKDNNGKPLEGAAVTLQNSKDSAIIKHTFSAKSGDFLFNNIDDGSYFISARLIGFSNAKTPVFEILNGNASVNDVVITVEPISKMLNNVTIRSTKPLIENKMDKTVVNVDAYITNSGNTALDLLSTSPNVEVDPSGNISIKGKQGVIILIDGKQTYLSGTDLSNLLTSMPSSQVSQIEIMTQPSAKYDASGNSGIINILTKKNKQAGFNADVSLNYTQGVYPKTLNSLILNYRVNKLNVFGSMNYNYTHTFTNRVWHRYLNSTTQNNLFTQTNRNTPIVTNITLNGGLDYAVSAKTTIGIVASTNNVNIHDQFISHSILQDFNQAGAIQSITDGTYAYKRPWSNTDLNFNLKTSFNKKQELTANLNYDTYNFNTSQQNTDLNYNTDGSFKSQLLQQLKLPSSVKIYTAKADYTYPVNKGLKIEAGLKSSYVNTDYNAQYYVFMNNDYVLNQNQSNHFVYHENVNAAYVNYSGTIGKWDLQAGLRAEQSNNKGIQYTINQTFTNNYLQLFPSVYVGYDEDKNNKYVFSYGRRINRPNYSDLNPFVQYLDLYTRMSGNPYLKPVFTNNFEFNYSYKNNLQASAFYTITNGDISTVYLQENNSNIQLITQKNVSSSTAKGFSLNYNSQLKNWWSLTLFYTLTNSHFSGPLNDGYVDVNMTTHMFNLTQQFLLGNGWATEMNGSYRNKGLFGPTFVSGPQFRNTFGVSKEVFNKKASIKLKISDPFVLWKYNYNYSKFESLYTHRDFHEESQKVGITFTYRFSQGQKAAESNKKVYKPEENSRVN